MADAKPFSDEEYKPYLPGTIEAIRDTANKNNQLVSSQLFRQVVNSLIATIAERDKRIEELKKELLTIAEDAVIDARLRWAEEEVLLKSTPDTATAIYCRKCGKAYPSDYDDWVYHEKDQRYYCRECSKVEPDPRQIDIDVAKALGYEIRNYAVLGVVLGEGKKDLPPYSTDVATAIEAMEEYCGSRYGWHLSKGMVGWDDFVCSIGVHDPIRRKTKPLAICHAIIERARKQK